MRKNIRYAARRTATVAGIFYPEDPGELAATVHRMLSEAPSPTCSPVAIMSPHGAFSHSGAIAAAAWNAVSGLHPAKVVIVGPSHNAWETGIFLPESELFETPLGDVRIDSGLVASLARCGSAFRAFDIPHLEEHCIEVQLPFMQILFPEALLVPVIVSKPNQSKIEMFTAAIDTVFGDSPRDTLFVITTDLAADKDAAFVHKRAAEFSRLCASGDRSGLLAASLAQDAPCGAGALAAIHDCRFMRGCRCTIIREGDSEAMRDSPEEHIVGYAAVAFCRA